MRLLHAERKKCAPAYASVTQAITRCACGEARCCGDGLYSEGLCGAGGSASAGAGDDDEPEREPGAQALAAAGASRSGRTWRAATGPPPIAAATRPRAGPLRAARGALLRRWVRSLRFAKAALSHDPRVASPNALLAATSRAIVTRATIAAAALRSASLRASRGAPDPLSPPRGGRGCRALSPLPPPAAGRAPGGPGTLRASATASAAASAARRQATHCYTPGGRRHFAWRREQPGAQAAAAR